MRTTVHRSIFVILILVLFLHVANAERELQLAGIRLGQAKQSVVDLLKIPDGKIIPVPPIESLAGGVARPTAANANTGISSTDALTTLVFIETKTGDEIPLGSPAPSGTAATGSTTGAQSANTFLPAWAYAVRVNTLTLNQEELIYKINNKYSIGITLTKQGDDFLVSDIIICSFEPLTVDPKNPNAKLTKIDATSKKLNKSFPAATAKEIRIGSRFADVMKKYGWTEYLYPFSTTQIGKITDQTTPSVPVSKTSTASAGSSSTTTGSVGSYPVKLTDGRGENLEMGFSKSLLVMYPEAGVSFTLVNFTVVRIQTGYGVVPPQVNTPTGTSTFPGTNTTGGGGGTRPQPVKPPAGGQNTDDEWF